MKTRAIRRRRVTRFALSFIGLAIPAALFAQAPGGWMPTSRTIRAEYHADVLNRGITIEEAMSWENFGVIDWVDEAYQINEEFAYRLPVGDRIDHQYLVQAVRHSETQIQRAGVRLAFLINAAAAGTMDFAE